VSGPAPGDGLLLIDKPSGITSHDAVDRVRRALGVKKVGHSGTLDPMATGLLVLGVGRGTRSLRFLGDMPKTYEGTMRLGVETTTLDADGEVTRTAPVYVVDVQLTDGMAWFLGQTEQTPPAFSAVKVGGRKLYEAARKGEALEARPRPITVTEFTMTGRQGDDVAFRVVCGGGTYVRVLAADLGKSLGCGAHLTQLRRTRIGPFEVDAASPPDAPGQIVPLAQALQHLPRLTLDAEEALAAGHGSILGPAGIEGPYGIFGPDDRLIGIYADESSKARPLVIFAPAP
jgi:tRNA pseudouridine55 synthase